ncbi:MAG: uroporphyrinogen-III synthase [Bacteroidales bacterium]|nr:uroporphyrinogen-III synthase [Bacteroidales bacterium]MDE6831147.1 uroporphyrinogen-III synthase [Muribaculaceae bacterium]
MKISKILVSQPKPSSDKSPYYDIAERYNVELIFRPFIKVEGLTAREFRQQKINLADFTAVIFTARTAIDHFFALAEEMRYHIPDDLKYFCTSESIALYLQKYIVYRKRKIFYCDNGKIADLVPLLTKHAKEKYLYVVSDVNKDDTAVLDNGKIQYTRAIMYRTVSNDFAPDEPLDYDALLFFSPAGIESLKKNFPDFDQTNVAIGTFGVTTARAVEQAGLRLDFQAPTPQTPSMPAALDLFLKNNLEK